MPSPTVRRDRTPRTLPATALLLGLLFAGATGADPLYPAGSHAGEDHAYDAHGGEFLQEIDLSAADLTACDLAASDLRDASLADASLAGADLSAAVLRDVDFTAADLRDAVLADADAKNSIFAGALLGGADLDGTYFKNAVFPGAELLGADFSGADGTAHADFHTAYYDDATVFHPDMDTSGMYEVVGTCPSDPSLAHVDTDGDGAGDECHALRSMPEPGALAMLGAGGALLAALTRRRTR